MLLNNKTLDAIIEGKISVVFRVWKRPTVKRGGTLKTRKGVLFIENVEIINPAEITQEDLRSAGFESREELCEMNREGDFFRITVSFSGEDPRIALRQNVDIAELAAVCETLRKTGSWTTQFLQMIHDQPNIHAQILADQTGLEKLKFKTKVRKLKSLGLTESLRPGYRLSPRGERILEMLKA